MIRRPPRSTQSRSSAASDVYKRQLLLCAAANVAGFGSLAWSSNRGLASMDLVCAVGVLSLIHISEPTRPY